MIAAVVGVLIAAIVFGVVIPLCYWRFRSPSDLHIADSLNLEAWTAVPADAHHSNTDLIKYKGQYVMAHATSPWHFASNKCRLVIRTSGDDKKWQVRKEIRVQGEDVRDPTFAVIQDRLFMYFFPNTVLDPKPHDTFYCVSDDGINWSEPKRLSIGEGWLLWRPRTFDGTTHYSPAYMRDFSRVSLFKSTAGIEWSEVSVIAEGNRPTETDMIFRPDGTMLVTVRVEMTPATRWGHHPEGHTMIGIASHPYTEWKLTRSDETRLDGPCLFQTGEHTYGVGRRHVGGREWMGSCWGRKRTSLYLIEPDRMIFLSDFPSCGDTSYAGAVVDRESILICYYTSPPERDWFWLMGMLSKSSIEMVRFKIADLEELAFRCRSEP